MQVSMEFFHDVIFTDNFDVKVVETEIDAELECVTVLYVFKHFTNKRIAVLERVISNDGITYELKEGIYEELKGQL